MWERWRKKDHLKMIQKKRNEEENHETLVDNRIK